MKKSLLTLGMVAALSPALASAEGYYYVGASYGATELEVSDSDKAALSAAGFSTDEDDNGFKVFGGYRYSDNFAVEAFYTDLGEATISGTGVNASVEADSFGLSALGILPVANNVELFGKLGVHTWDAELSSSAGDVADDDGVDLTFGVGAAYNLQEVAFRLELERFELDDEDVNMISAGVTLGF